MAKQTRWQQLRSEWEVLTLYQRFESVVALVLTAVIGLTKSIAADYVRQGIRFNAVAPRTIDTPSLQGRINSYADPVQARKDFVARQPMGRLGTVDDMVPIFIYLASDESSFATGNVFSIDGGMTI